MMPSPRESKDYNALVETPPTSPEIDKYKLYRTRWDSPEYESDIHSITGSQILECQLFQNEIKDHLLKLKYILRTWVRYLSEIYIVQLRLGESVVSAMTETRDKFRDKCRVRYETAVWRLRCLNHCHMRNIDFGYPALPEWQVTALHHFLILLTTEQLTETLVSTVIEMDMGLGDLSDSVGIMGF